MNFSETEKCQFLGSASCLFAVKNLSLNLQLAYHELNVGD